MRMPYFVVLALLGLFSTLHVLQAIVRFDTLSTAALGFVGAGLFGIALALINLLFLLDKARGWITKVKGVASNSAGVIYFYLLSTSTGSWQDWGILVTTCLALILSVIVILRTDNRPEREAV